MIVAQDVGEINILIAIMSLIENQRYHPRLEQRHHSPRLSASVI